MPLITEKRHSYPQLTQLPTNYAEFLEAFRGGHTVDDNSYLTTANTVQTAMYKTAIASGHITAQPGKVRGEYLKDIALTPSGVVFLEALRTGGMSFQVISEEGKTLPVEIRFCIYCGIPSPACAPFMDEVFENETSRGFLHKQCEPEWRQETSTGKPFDLLFGLRNPIFRLKRPLVYHLVDGRANYARYPIGHGGGVLWNGPAEVEGSEFIQSSIVSKDFDVLPDGNYQLYVVRGVSGGVKNKQFLVPQSKQAIIFDEDIRGWEAVEAKQEELLHEFSLAGFRPVTPTDEMRLQLAKERS